MANPRGRWGGQSIRDASEQAKKEAMRRFDQYCVNERKAKVSDKCQVFLWRGERLRGRLCACEISHHRASGCLSVHCIDRRPAIYARLHQRPLRPRPAACAVVLLRDAFPTKRFSFLLLLGCCFAAPATCFSFKVGPRVPLPGSPPPLRMHAVLRSLPNLSAVLLLVAVR